MPRPLLVIGFGNMGSAITAGALRAGLLTPADLTIIEPTTAKAADLAARGARVFPSVASLLALPPKAAILLAIKPQGFTALCEQLTAARLTAAPLTLGPEHLLISILAGVRLDRLRAGLAAPCVTRAMPNLPASVGQGCTAICHDQGLSPNDALYAEQLFLSTGPVVVEAPEPMMDAFTALAGSGPAYVFYLAEALTRAARQQGFEPEAARAIVRQTIIGAARLLEADHATPEALRAAVTSKGGTTASACETLDRLEVMDAVDRAVAAGTQRARELSAV